MQQVCDYEVAHKSASRVHACMGFDGDRFQIQDLDSSHGTVPASHKLSIAPLDRKSDFSCS